MENKEMEELGFSSETQAQTAALQSMSQEERNLTFLSVLFEKGK